MAQKFFSTPSKEYWVEGKWVSCSPPCLPSVKTSYYVPTGKPRGRPKGSKKIKTNHNAYQNP